MTADEYKKQIVQMSKTMFRYCLSRTDSYHDAEDLSQEILLISCKGENKFPNEKAFYAFVWRTADNILKSRYRAKNIFDTQELDENISDDSWKELEDEMREKEQLSLIVRELALLSSNYRRVMTAYYIDGLSVKNISLRFSLSESMVKYLLFQSRKKVKEGVNMERNYGKLSYAPVELSLRFWGGKNIYWNLFDSKVRQNIIMACYYDKQNEEQLSLQLGVPTAYLENDISKLVEYGVLDKRNGYYRSNIIILSKKELTEISQANEKAVSETADFIKKSIDLITEDIRSIGFYGCDMPLNSIKWMILSQVLRMAYIEKYFDDSTLDFPEDIFGNKCFRWLTEDNAHDDIYTIGISNYSVGDIYLHFFDVFVNGEPVHTRLDKFHEDALISLIGTQPRSRTEKMICAELVEKEILIRTENGLKWNFPYFDKEQYSKFREIAEPVVSEIYSRASKSETLETRIGIITGYTPQHLIGYAKQMSKLTQFEEMQDIIRMLCESGWLLPWKSGMIASAVMCVK